MKRRNMMSLARAAGAQAGALMSCGPIRGDRWHRVATFDRVGKLGTMKALGLPNPQPLRLRADVVLQ